MALNPAQTLEDFPVLAIATVVLGAAVFIYGLLNRAAQLSHVPGPFYSSFTNLRLKIATLTGGRWEYIHSLHQQYGPIIRISPNEVSAVTLPAAKAVYKMGGNYPKSAFYDNFQGGPEEPANIFPVRDIRVHGQHRRIHAHDFAAGSVKRMEGYISSNVRLAIQRMHEETSDRGVTDIFKWFLFMATDVIGEASFGESFRTLEKGEKTPYCKDLEFIGKSTLYRQELSFIFKCLHRFGFAKKINELVARMDTYAEESLDRYYRNLRDDPDNAKHTLLAKDFALFEKGEVSKRQLMVDARGNIIAGTDTTAVTMTSAVYLLAQNPEVQKALHAEVSPLPTGYSDDDTRELPLLNAVIKETLRLRPAVGMGLPRSVPREGVTLSDQFIPGGTTIGIPAYSMHRDPKIFPSPETFDPYRWMEPTQNMKDALVPFGGGSRVCIGMHFAQVEMRYALVEFYKAFPTGVEIAEGFEGFEHEKEMRPFQSFLSFPRGKRCFIRQH